MMYFFKKYIRHSFQGHKLTSSKMTSE